MSLMPHCIFKHSVQSNKVGTKLIIEATYVSSPRADYLIPNYSKCCSLCNLNLNVKHTVCYCTKTFGLYTITLLLLFLGCVDS